MQMIHTELEWRKNQKAPLEYERKKDFFPVTSSLSSAAKGVKGKSKDADTDATSAGSLLKDIFGF